MTFLEQVGQAAIVQVEDAGALTMQFLSVLRKLPRVLPVFGARRRWRSTVAQMLAIGASAFPMAGAMSLCTGFILALQSASELRRFGALQFVVDLVAIGFTRELGHHHRPLRQRPVRVSHIGGDRNHGRDGGDRRAARSQTTSPL
jgi:ABC-type transporter Mla maintaining outer membrane lipid asymmetry permease subunit MlaE